MLCLALQPTFASDAERTVERSRELYQRTEYAAALEMLDRVTPKDSAILLLMGQCYYMSGHPRTAASYLERAVKSNPGDARSVHWLGRAYARRAETANVFLAPGLALKAKRNFEAAVQLDPSNSEAVGDLFEYYMEAPGMLGGGAERAEQLAARFRSRDRAEYEYRLARLAERRKQFRAAEAHYRRAAELAPNDPGRLIDVAKFCEAQGRQRETDEFFRRARSIVPEAPVVWFEQARIYVNSHRNLEAAKSLLKRYLAGRLTPLDPPRHEARKLLAKVSGTH